MILNLLTYLHERYYQYYHHQNTICLKYKKLIYHQKHKNQGDSPHNKGLTLLLPNYTSPVSIVISLNTVLTSINNAGLPRKIMLFSLTLQGFDRFSLTFTFLLARRFRYAFSVKNTF